MAQLHAVGPSPQPRGALGHRLPAHAGSGTIPAGAGSTSAPPRRVPEAQLPPAPDDPQSTAEETTVSADAEAQLGPSSGESAGVGLDEPGDDLTDASTAAAGREDQILHPSADGQPPVPEPGLSPVKADIEGEPPTAPVAPESAQPAPTDASTAEEEAAPVVDAAQPPTVDPDPVTSLGPQPAGDLGFGDVVITPDGSRGILAEIRDGQYFVMNEDDEEIPYPRSALRREAGPPPAVEGDSPRAGLTTDADEEAAAPSRLPHPLPPSGSSQASARGLQRDLDARNGTAVSELPGEPCRLSSEIGESGNDVALRSGVGKDHSPAPQSTEAACVVSVLPG